MKKILIMLLSILLLLSVMTGCGSDEGEAYVQSVSMICGLGAVGMNNRFSGVVSSGAETKVEKNEEFTVSEILVAVGDEVKEGDVLFTYDMEAGQLDLEKAKLTLEQQQASLEDLQDQKSDLEKQKSKASGDLELQLSLEIRDVETQISEAEYNLKTQQTEISKLEASLETSQVTAPITGKVQSINESGGTDDYGNMLPFMTLIETSDYVIKGYVNEANMGDLMEGTEMTAYSRVSDESWHGAVSKIDYDNPAQNSNYYYSDDTGSSSKYPFYVTLDDSDGLMLGQHVYLEIGNGMSETDGQTINLPSYFINDADGNAWVWARGSNGKLEKRGLSLGNYDADMDTYVITEGLDASDYIAFPDDSLKTGMSCSTYDESNFSDDEDEEYGEEYYDDGMIYEDSGDYYEEDSTDGVVLYEDQAVAE